MKLGGALANDPSKVHWALTSEHAVNRGSFQVAAILEIRGARAIPTLISQASKAPHVACTQSSQCTGRPRADVSIEEARKDERAEEAPPLLQRKHAVPLHAHRERAVRPGGHLGPSPGFDHVVATYLGNPAQVLLLADNGDAIRRAGDLHK